MTHYHVTIFLPNSLLPLGRDFTLHGSISGQLYRSLIVNFSVEHYHHTDQYGNIHEGDCYKADLSKIRQSPSGALRKWMNSHPSSGPNGAA